MHEDFWRSRGYLPHFDEPGALQFVTYRLFDSLPKDVVAKWKEELGVTGREAGREPKLMTLSRRVAAYEDAGHGECFLAIPQIASIVRDNLLRFDGERYRLLAWCVMPNHVHALIETRAGHPLSSVVYSWKSYTAKEANKALGRQGHFWMKEYHDRYMRNAAHAEQTIRYIEQNPVKAGLVEVAEMWQWSSAGVRLLEDG